MQNHWKWVEKSVKSIFFHLNVESKNLQKDLQENLEKVGAGPTFSQVQLCWIFLIFLKFFWIFWNFFTKFPWFILSIWNFFPRIFLTCLIYSVSASFFTMRTGEPGKQDLMFAELGSVSLLMINSRVTGHQNRAMLRVSKWCWWCWSIPFGIGEAWSRMIERW